MSGQSGHIQIGGGYMFLELMIDDYQLEYGMPAFIQELKIIETINLSFPILTLKINDERNELLDELHIGDHNKLTIRLGETEDKCSPPLEFRTFNFKRQPANEGFTYLITAQIDSPLLTKAIQAWSGEGTSAEVLEQLLRRAGLTPDQEDWLTTNDRQIWLNPGVSWSTWIGQTVAHGFKDVNALPTLAIEATKECRYFDIIDRLHDEVLPSHKLYYGYETGISEGQIVMDIEDTNKGGFLGTWVGYGYEVNDQRLDGKLYRSDGVALDIEGYAPIEQQAYQQIESARREYVPHECGNTHKNWWAAYHANMRKAALFTQELTVLLYEYSDIRTGDCVELVCAPMVLNVTPDREDPVPEERSGKYVVIGKVRRIVNNKYAEGLVITRVQMHLQGKQELVSQDGKGHTPVPRPVERTDMGVSKWTYETQQRYNRPKDGCRDIVDEESMPTSTDSTLWDEVSDFTDGNSARNGPYELALTGKQGTVRNRDKDTRPPA
jgi:hypothetical protein